MLVLGDVKLSTFSSANPSGLSFGLKPLRGKKEEQEEAEEEPEAGSLVV